MQVNRSFILTTPPLFKKGVIGDIQQLARERSRVLPSRKAELPSQCQWSRAPKAMGWSSGSGRGA